LGCGSIGGNITSDNISPLHLINIKRLAYGKDGWRPGGQSRNETSNSARIAVTRQDVSSVVDQLLSQRGISTTSQTTSSSTLTSTLPQTNQPSSTTVPVTVSFVCEDDVRQALRKSEKIYVTAKSIITPAARDLGTDKDVLVFVS